MPEPADLRDLMREFARRPGLRKFLSSHLRLDPEAFLWPVIADVTVGCNLACRMCRSRVAPRDERAGRRLFERLASAVLPHARDIALGCRHEPLLHPRLPESIAVLDAARRRRGSACRIVVLTTGSLLEPRLARRLIGSGLDAMLFSISTTEPRTFAAMQPPAVWKDVEERLAGFLAASRGRPAAAAQMLLMAPTLAQVVPSVRRLAGLGFRWMQLVQMVAAPPPADADVVWTASRRGRLLLAVAKLAQAEARRRGIELSVPQEAAPAMPGELHPLFCDGCTWDEPLLARSRPSVCVLPWSKVRVDHRGRVFPCQMMQSPSLSWGSIMTESFSDVVNSERAVRMRRDLLAGIAPNPVCARCPIGPRADCR